MNTTPDCAQFLRIKIVIDEIILKTEKDITGILLEMNKQDLAEKIFYQLLQTTYAQPARLYEWAKVHKENTPMRSVLSISGSSYSNLQTFSTPLFEKVPGAIIETSSLIARQKYETLEVNAQTVSLDVKSLYTIVPVSEAIESALRCPYSSNTPPVIERSTLKLLLKLAVTKVILKKK